VELSPQQNPTPSSAIPQLYRKPPVTSANVPGGTGPSPSSDEQAMATTHEANNRRRKRTNLTQKWWDASY